MFSLMLICSVFIVTYGLPEPPPRYQYSPPEKSNISSYAAPLGSVGPLPSTKSGNTSESTISSHKNVSASRSDSRVSTNNSVGNSSRNANASAQSSTNSTSSDHLFREIDSKSAGVIRKHIYVNIPPPEIEVDRRQKVHVKLPQPQKHYKIIFIKAPSASVPIISNIPTLKQDEEKTLVYVLVKNVEEQLKIEIPTVAPTEPSRPEVYFINYKLQNEKSNVKGADKGKGVSSRYGPAKPTGHSEGDNATRRGSKISTQRNLSLSKSNTGPY